VRLKKQKLIAKERDEYVLTEKGISNHRTRPFRSNHFPIEGRWNGRVRTSAFGVQSLRQMFDPGDGVVRERLCVTS
jgi:hypothetical protein